MNPVDVPMIYYRFVTTLVNFTWKMIVKLKSKRSATKYLSTDEKGVLDHYLRIVKVFGKDQIYLINIGIV